MPTIVAVALALMAVAVPLAAFDAWRADRADRDDTARHLAANLAATPRQEARP